MTFFIHLRLLLILLQKSFFTLLLGHLVPSLLPSINLRCMTAKQFSMDLMVLAPLLEIGGFTQKVLYLNSFVLFARIHQIHYCSTVKTGTQHVGQHVTIETGWLDNTGVACGTCLWCQEAMQTQQWLLTSVQSPAVYVPRQRGKPPCKTQLVQRDMSRTESSSHLVPQQNWWYMSEEEFLCHVETAPGKSL